MIVICTELSLLSFLLALNAAGTGAEKVFTCHDAEKLKATLAKHRCRAQSNPIEPNRTFDLRDVQF